MKKLLLATALLVIMSAPAFAWNYHFGTFADGTSPFDHNNNWAPIDYPSGVGYLPSPGTIGEGGEKMDLEGLTVMEDDQYVYVALANSFGYTATSTAWKQSYNLGDLFIGVDGGKYDYAVGISDLTDNTGGTTGLYRVNTWNGIPNYDGTYYGVAAVRDAVGAFDLADDKEFVDDVSFFKGFDATYEQNPMKNFEQETYVWEFQIAKSALGAFNSLDFHITMACGNDLMEETYEAIPEPTTLLLFGFGLAGAAVVRKYRR